MAADVDPQRAVAGELLAAVWADLLLLARVCLQKKPRRLVKVILLKNLLGLDSVRKIPTLHAFSHLYF